MRLIIFKLIVGLLFAQTCLVAEEETRDINPFELKPLPVFSTCSKGLQSFELEGVMTSLAFNPVNYVCGWEKDGNYYLHIYSIKEEIPIASFVNGKAVYYDPCVSKVFFINENLYPQYKIFFKNDKEKISGRIEIGISSKEGFMISFDPYSILTAGTMPNNMISQKDGTWLWTNRSDPKHLIHPVDAVYKKIDEYPTKIRHFSQNEKTKEYFLEMALEAYQFNKPINRNRLKLPEPKDFSTEVKTATMENFPSILQAYDLMKLLTVIYYARTAMEFPENMEEELFKTVLLGNDMKLVAKKDKLLSPHIKSAFKDCYDLKYKPEYP